METGKFYVKFLPVTLLVLLYVVFATAPAPPNQIDIYTLRIRDCMVHIYPGIYSARPNMLTNRFDSKNDVGPADMRKQAKTMEQCFLLCLMTPDCVQSIFDQSKVDAAQCKLSTNAVHIPTYTKINHLANTNVHLPKAHVVGFECSKHEADLPLTVGHQLISGPVTGSISPALPHSWPWIIELRDKNYQYICDVALISLDEVITSPEHADGDILLAPALCFKKFNSKDAVAYAGRHHSDQYDEGLEVIKVENVLYLGEHFYIMKLRDKFSFSKTISPIRPAQQEPANGATCVVAGWSKQYGPETPELMQIEWKVDGKGKCVTVDKSKHGADCDVQNAPGHLLMCKENEKPWQLHGVRSNRIIMDESNETHEDYKFGKTKSHFFLFNADTYKTIEKKIKAH